MPNALILEGFVRDVKYEAHLADNLVACDFNSFDINKVKAYGIINFKNRQVAYSKWTSPKRTRTYPFARLYNIYNFPKTLTIIPVMKDEGLDGDLDKIQYSTISWMNLLNVYIVLAYYVDAHKSQKSKQEHKNKLNRQKLDVEHVNEQIKEILTYRQSALHWNRSLFEDHFADTYEKAVDAYEEISLKTGVLVHPRKTKLQYLKIVRQEYQKFREISQKASDAAARRESKTKHLKEHLLDGEKYNFFIENYLGGVYSLTIDELVREKEKYLIQESKNSTQKSLPSLSDIKDGLFRLILYANLDSLKVNSIKVDFSTRLKLTGYDIRGTLQLPCNNTKFDKFIQVNKSRFTRGQLEILRKLNLETTRNRNLTVEVKGNNG